MTKLYNITCNNCGFEFQVSGKFTTEEMESIKKCGCGAISEVTVIPIYPDKDKKHFIETELNNCIKKADSDIDSLLYSYSNYDEFCEVKYNNGHIRKVCITADSLIAIIKDVVKAIL